MRFLSNWENFNLRRNSYTGVAPSSLLCFLAAVRWLAMSVNFFYCRDALLHFRSIRGPHPWGSRHWTSGMVGREMGVGCLPLGVRKVGVGRWEDRSGHKKPQSFFPLWKVSQEPISSSLLLGFKQKGQQAELSHYIWTSPLVLQDVPEPGMALGPWKYLFCPDK